MKRPLARSRGPILLAGTLLVLASVAWGAAVRPHASARKPVAHARIARVHRATPSTAKPKVAVAVAPRAAAALAKSQPAPVAGQAGMRIFRDPESGDIGPPTAENAAILAREAAPEVDVTNIPQVQLPNGGWELLLDGRIEDAAIIRLDAQGHRVMTCTNDPKTALKQTPAPAPSQQREDR